MLKLAKTGKKGQVSLTKAILQQVGIYPIEIYSDERKIAFFLEEDSLTPEQTSLAECIELAVT